MLKNIAKIFAFVLLAILGGAFGSQILSSYFPEYQQPVYVTERKEIYIQENTALTEAIGKVQNAIVAIKSKTKDGKNLKGAGLSLTSDGLMVTLSDLVPQSGTNYFYVSGEAVKYQILKRDSNSGLVLVKLEKNLPSAAFADAAKINLGQRVFVLGVAFASSTPENIADEGIVSRIGPDYLETNIIRTENMSGSVLFDVTGNVLGINKIDSAGDLITIPSTVIREFTGF